MPLKAEDVVKALEIDLSKYEAEPEPVKAFVTNFGGEWMRKKDVPDVNEAKGLWNNVLRGKLRKSVKENGLELDVNDESDPIDLMPEAFKLLNGKNAATIAELNEKLKSNTPEKAEKEWSEKYGKVETKLKDTEALLNGLGTKYQDLEKSIADREVKAWEDNQWESAVSKVKWKQGISDYEKKGFLSEQRAKYKAQKDDKGEAYASDADGNRIPDPAKPAKFKGLEEILTDNVKAAKLYEVHEKGGQRINTVQLRTEGNAEQGEQQPTRVHRRHPSLLGAQR